MSLRGKKSQAIMDFSNEMSPDSRVEAPLIIDPLQPENLLFSPRPTRMRKPSQKITAMEADEKASPPPIFSVPRISGRRKSVKKRVHNSSEDEADDVDETSELETSKHAGETYKTNARKRHATIAKSNNLEKVADTVEELITPVSAKFPHLAATTQPREYKSPYQTGSTLPVLQQKAKQAKSELVEVREPNEQHGSLEATSSSSEVQPKEKIKKKIGRPTKKIARQKSTTIRVPAIKKVKKPVKKPKKEVKPRTPSARVASKAKAKQLEVTPNDNSIPVSSPQIARREYKAPKSRNKQASVDLLQHQHRALVTSIVESLTQEQLLKLVIEGACDIQSDGILFNRLIQEQNSRATSATSQALKFPTSHLNGLQGSHSENNSRFGVPPSGATEPNHRHSGYDQTDDVDESDDIADGDKILTTTQIKRLQKREERADQWRSSAKAYLVPEGYQPPKKGPIPVGIAKKRKNVVSAGFDYRMRFHYRLTKYDRDGNLIGHDGTPAIRRDLVDFHPTLAHLSEEEFFREVLKRQLTNEAKGIAY